MIRSNPQRKGDPREESSGGITTNRAMQQLGTHCAESSWSQALPKRTHCTKMLTPRAGEPCTRNTILCCTAHPSICGWIERAVPKTIPRAFPSLDHLHPLTSTIFCRDPCNSRYHEVQRTAPVLTTLYTITPT